MKTLYFEKLVNSVSGVVKYGNRYQLELLPDNVDGGIIVKTISIDYAPSVGVIKSFTEKLINEECQEKIESGHTYNVDGVDETVWLTSENQQNYKVMYDIAMQTNGANLPCKVKLGADNIVELSTVNQLSEFYLGCVSHIQSCIEECWQKKASVDYEVYEQAIEAMQ